MLKKIEAHWGKNSHIIQELYTKGYAQSQYSKKFIDETFPEIAGEINSYKNRIEIVLAREGLIESSKPLWQKIIDRKSFDEIEPVYEVIE